MRSKLETNFAKSLDKNKVEFDYEEKSFKYYFKAKKCECAKCGSKKDIIEWHNYTPDFYLPEYNVFVETKGLWTGADRRKHLAIKEQYPDIRIIMAFQANNKFHKKSQIRYLNWCESNGIDGVVIGKDASFKKVKEIL